MVEYCRTASTAWICCHEKDTIPINEIVVGDLKEEGEFCFRVAAVNKAGRGPSVEVPGSHYMSKTSHIVFECEHGQR